MLCLRSSLLPPPDPAPSLAQLAQAEANRFKDAATLENTRRDLQSLRRSLQNRVIDAGVGSEMRRPLGIAIVGGLIVSQKLTLSTTPVTYLCLRWRARKRHAAATA